MQGCRFLLCMKQIERHIDDTRKFLSDKGFTPRALGGAIIPELFLNNLRKTLEFIEKEYPLVQKDMVFTLSMATNIENRRLPVSYEFDFTYGPTTGLLGFTTIKASVFDVRVEFNMETITQSDFPKVPDIIRSLRGIIAAQQLREWATFKSKGLPKRVYPNR